MKAKFRLSTFAFLVCGLAENPPAGRAADCNANGVDDALDLLDPATPDCNRNGVPDECDLQPRGFELVAAPEIPGRPTAIATADLDRDGHPDLAALEGSRETQRLVSFFGKGDGTFERRSSIVSGPESNAPLLADLDGDGFPDFVWANAFDPEAVLMVANDGKGGFGMKKTLPSPGDLFSPQLFAIDVDGDGDLDLVAGSRASPGEVLLNGGNAVFDTPKPIPAVAPLAAGDFDGDGDVDLEAAGSGGFSLGLRDLRNDGTGTFTLAAQWTADGSYDPNRWLLAADLDVDGRPDLIVSAQTQGQSVAALLFNEGGTFRQPIDFPAPGRGPLLSPDLDGDGRPEIVISAAGANLLAVLADDGRGNFRAYAEVPFTAPTSAAATDLNGDGRIDLAVVGRGPNSEGPGAISILLDRPRSPSADCDRDGIPDECAIESGTAADCNRNGVPDGCDLSAGASGDCNRNGTPDECEVAAPVIALEGPAGFSPPGGILAAADLDGDGRPDLAAGNGETVSILRNQGLGRLERRVDFPVRGGVAGIEIADLDGDGHPDVLTCGGFDQLNVLRNRGEALFDVVESWNVGTAPVSLSAVDSDRDGDLDVAVVNRDQGTLSVLPNDGLGSLGSSLTVPLPGKPQWIDAGDLDEDGRTDFAVASQDPNELTVVFNEGQSVFTPLAPMALLTFGHFVGIRDLDRDGRPDFLVPGWEAAVIRNLGGRAFAPVRDIQPPDLPVGVDVDGDGAVDIRITLVGILNEFVYHSVSWLEDGQDPGKASFLLVPTLYTGGYAVAADFDGDGLADIAEQGKVLFNQGDRTFLGRGFFPAGGFPIEGTAADLDGDGQDDLAVVRGSPEGLTVFFSSGKGSVPPLDLATGNGASAVRAADLDGDRDTDLLVANRRSTFLTVYRNDGRGRLDGEALEVGQGQIDVAPADLDGDGDLDLAVSLEETSEGSGDHAFLLLENPGDGTFRAVNRSPGAISQIEAEDLDGDGRTDLALLDFTQFTRTKLSILLARGPFDFAVTRFELALVYHFRGLRIGDLDGDGRLDLLLPGGRAAFNEGGGRFRPPSSLALDGFSGDLAELTDLDGDGRLDLVSGQLPGYNLSFYRNQGAARFLRVASTYSGNLSRVIPADLNGDGQPDLAVLLARYGPNLSIYQNRTALSTAPDCNRNGVPDSCDLDAGSSADCNRNGIPDDCDIAGEVRFAPPLMNQLPFSQAVFVASGDFDRDADADFVLAINSTLQIAENDGAGNFTMGQPQTLTVGLANLQTADLDGDGGPDLIGGFDPIYLVRKLPGELRTTEIAGAKGTLSRPLPDVDGDGDLDLVLTDATRLQVFLNDGQGNFSAGSSSPLSLNPFSVQPGDLDGDGRMDLVLMDRPGNRLFIYRGDGASFAPGRTVQVGQFPVAMAIADLDGDRLADLAVTRSETYDVALFLNRGTRGFEPSGPVGMPPPTFSQEYLLPADLDGDGWTDLVTPGRIFRNGGGAGFEAPVIQGVAGDTALVVDVDGDGLSDLIGFETGGRSGLQVLLNRSRTAASFDRDGNLVPDGCQPDCDLNGSPDSWEVAVGLAADCNGNGLPDGCDIAAGGSRDRRGGAADGIPDECQPATFHRGDANGDEQVDITDGLCLLTMLFLEGGGPESSAVYACLEAADANNDGQLDCTDPISVLAYLFLGGLPPPAPGPPPGLCGTDPDSPGTPRDLGCENYPHCEG